MPDLTGVVVHLLRELQDWTDLFLTRPGFFTVVDTFGIELIHPTREGRSPHQVSWSWNMSNKCDSIFLPLLEPFVNQTIVLDDVGFRSRQGIPANLEIFRKGMWNERGTIETVYFICENVCHLKKIFHRAEAYIGVRLSYVAALFNLL